MRDALKFVAACCLPVIFTSIFSTVAPARASAQQTAPKMSRPEASPQSQPQSQSQPQPKTSATPAAPEEVGEDETVRVDTVVVTVPVVVMSREGKYVAGLRREDFRLFEDGVEQDIAFFAPVETPVTVALLIDVSDSTRFKIEEIQEAAVAFVEQLREGDRALVVSFDQSVVVMTEPTADRRVLREAIRRTRTGGGTRLYDALAAVINERLNRFAGRKAVVIFTDGVDTMSKQATARSTVELVEELDAFVYSVQYSTYIEAARPRPSFDNDQLSMNRQTPVLQTARVLSPVHAAELEAQHRRASSYLEELARKTGGRRLRAADTKSLTQSFSQIAEELRWQYSLGYIPQTIARPGERRQIKVRVNTPKTVVRSRTNYTGSAPKDTEPRD
ncbi:MAG TPA: VWA domain-containing protein [Pyrinomonadaceae bacterium]|nr:VWA domain-containing protein [Pyrinomonadaceae bacterium]